MNPVPESLAYPMRDVSRCMTHYGSLKDRRCPRAAVVTVVIGCEAEYLRLNRVCAECLASLQVTPHTCGRCLQLGFLHSVQLIEIRPDEGGAVSNTSSNLGSGGEA